ncbi:MAG TPA: hypothetical protein PKD90_00425 [Phnomibacter sp.]|nr:hypothetical protein [Phnomibacter sp.]
MKKRILFTCACLVALGAIAQNNVGIGTAVPVQRLHLHGGTLSNTAINFSNDASAQGPFDGMRIGLSFVEGGSSNYGYVLVAEDIPLYLGTNSTLWGALSNTGNLGIGTVTPTLAKMQVVGKQGHTMLLARASTSGIGAQLMSDLPNRVGLEFNTHHDGGASRRLIAGYTSQMRFNSTTGDLEFYASSTTDAANTIPSILPALRLLGGNAYVHVPQYAGFGIIPHPDSGRVVIAHNSTSTSPTLQLVETSTTDFARIEFANQANNRYWQIAGNQSSLGTASDLLNFNHSSAGTIFTVAGNGNVGVGAAPAAGDGKLLVNYNSTTVNPHIKLRESTLGDFSRLEFTNTGAERVWHIAGQNVAGAGTTNRSDDILNIWNSSRGDIMTFRGDGRVGILTTTPANGFALSVNGNIICTELKVALTTNWPDYVFADNYALTPLASLENFIKANRHLPGIPNAATVEKEGITVGEMQKRMMEKIEELTLYIIQQQKEIEALKKRLE